MLAETRVKGQRSSQVASAGAAGFGQTPREKEVAERPQLQTILKARSLENAA